MNQRFRMRAAGARRYTVLFSFITSYLVVCLLPIVCSLVMLLPTRANMETELMRMNNIALSQALNSMEYTLDNALSLSYILSRQSRIETMLYYRQPLTTLQRYEISAALRGEMAGGIVFPGIKGYMIYFINGGFLLSNSGRYTEELAYETYFPKSGIAPGRFQEFLSQYYSRRVCDIGDELLFMQSIPFTSRAQLANIFVVINKADALNALKRVDWVKNGELYIFDENGNILLSNAGEGEYAAWTLSPNGEAVKNGATTLYSEAYGRNGWRYALIMNPKALEQSRESLIRTYIIYMAVALVSGLMMTMLFAGRNYRPIRRLLGSLEMDEQAGMDEYERIEFSVNRIRRVNEDMRAQVERKDMLIRRSRLVRLLLGIGDFTEFTREHNDSGLYFPHDGYMLALLCVRDMSAFEDGAALTGEEHPVERLYDMLLHSVETGLNARFRCYACDINGMVATLINFPASAGEARLHGEIADIREQIHKHARVLLDVSVSKAYSSIYGTPRAYRECEFCIQKSSASSASAQELLLCSSEPMSAQFRYTEDMEQALKGSLLSGNARAAEDILRELFRSFHEESPQPLLYRCLVSSLAVTLMRAAEAGGQKADALSAAQIAENALSTGAPGEIEAALIQMAKQICADANAGKESHNTELLSRVLDFIAENYADANLNNSMIADFAGISPAYLSRFFKQQTGYGLSGYISRIRVDSAKEIMRSDKNATVTEIAEATGFGNVATFIRIFKKLEGVTPGRYQ